MTKATCRLPELCRTLLSQPEIRGLRLSRRLIGSDAKGEGSKIDCAGNWP